MTRNMLQEHTQPMPSTSTIPRIGGTQPGVLDHTQSSRLLRLQGAKLSFATFDPLTAYAQGVPDFTKLNLASDLYRPRRVVIETAPSGDCTWRFVPSAKREEGVTDEGTWPRIVDLCGDFVEMTQDQWDIYKLDRMYECLVRDDSRPPTIQNVYQPRPPSPKLTGKHRMASPSPSPPRVMPPPRPTGGKNVFLESESESDDEGEVESMIVDDEPPPWRRPSFLRQRKEQLNKNRQERRDKLHQKMQFPSQGDETHPNISSNGIASVQTPKTPERCSATPEPGKRKVTTVLDTSWSPDMRELEELRLRNATNYKVTSTTKRTRTGSPKAAQRDIKLKKMKRMNDKRQRWTAELEARRLEREKRMLDEIMEEIPQSGEFSSNGDPQYVRPTSDTPSTADNDPFFQQSQGAQDEELLSDGEAAHRAAIEESRRKLAELEHDRPPWEESARERQVREEAEQQALKAEMEGRQHEEARKKSEVEARARKQRQEEEEMKKREQEKNVRRERDLREQERRKRQQRWSLGPWTTPRALERYRILSEAFDNTKFTAELPLVVEDVPWPTLQSPRSFSIEDVNWDSAERFFETIRPHLRLQDYKALVEKSHRRFHPDRWRSRNLLKTIEDETVRGCMEVAANTVAQALTPIWRSLTGR